MRYGQQEIEDERGRVTVFSPGGCLLMLPWQGGALWPNPDGDKVHWAVRCDYCYEVIVHCKDNREDLNEMEIIRYGQQEIEDERGRIIVFSPTGNSPLFPDVYHVRNDKRALCKDCYEIAIHKSVD